MDINLCNRLHRRELEQRLQRQAPPPSIKLKKKDDKLESHSSCQICFEIFEKEIYQCANGHIICSVCVSSVNNCPQCRISYGSIKIRSRVLEEILDKEMFECKFKDKGCNKTTNRKEISSHAKICQHSPEFVPLCKTIGYKNCEFSNVSATRAEIIQHFQQNHDAVFEQGDGFRIFLENFGQLQTQNQPCLWTPVILGLGGSDTSPLILLLGKIHSPVGFASWICVQIWGAEQQGQNFKISASLQKETTEEFNGSRAVNASSENVRFCWDMNALSTKFQTVNPTKNHLEIPLSFIQRGTLSIENSVTLAVSKTNPSNSNRDDIFWKDIWVFAQPNIESQLKQEVFRDGFVPLQGQISYNYPQGQPVQQNLIYNGMTMQQMQMSMDPLLMRRIPTSVQPMQLQRTLKSDLPADLVPLAAWAKL